MLTCGFCWQTNGHYWRPIIAQRRHHRAAAVRHRRHRRRNRSYPSHYLPVVRRIMDYG